MVDPLFARAQLAIEESRELQRQSHDLKTQVDGQREKLRQSLFEAAMIRSEIKAYRDDRE
jgi:hypothetical protein